MKSKLKFQIFFDLFFWFLVMILPFFVWKFQIEAVATTATFLDYVNMHFAFGFIQDIIDNISTVAFGGVFPISGYLSYLVAVEIFHVLFDIIVFIPRFAHKVINWGCEKW